LFHFIGLASSLFPFTVAPSEPLIAAESSAGSSENLNASHLFSTSSHPSGSGDANSPSPTATVRRNHSVQPAPESPHRDNQQTNSTAGGRVLSPVRVGSPPPHPRNSVIGSVGSDPHPFTQHHSMLLSSLMGNRLIK